MADRRLRLTTDTRSDKDSDEPATCRGRVPARTSSGFRTHSGKQCRPPTLMSEGGKEDRLNRQIITANLISRPVRTAVSILAVALEVTLILVIVGLTTGIMNDIGNRTAGVGGDIILRAPNAGIIMSFSTASMPVQIGEKIAREIPGVKA